MHRLQCRGLGAILDYSAEQDENSPAGNTHSLVSKLNETIDTAALVEGSKVAIKVTPFIPAAVMIRASERLLAGQEQSASDKQEIDQALGTLRRLCQRAASRNVSLMVDAEQSYFQPLIDSLALLLMREFNRDRPLISNTYQMYLKGSLPKLQRDLEQITDEGLCFGAKIVRGAYMVSEKKRSAELRLQCPIEDSIQSTHINFDSAAQLLIDAVDKGKRLEVMLATHNRDSVELAVKALKNTRLVSFGQLMGMGEELSSSLQARGFKAFKYLPIGPLHEVIPYLLRRAQENAALLQKGAHESNQILLELKHRLLRQ